MYSSQRESVTERETCLLWHGVVRDGSREGLASQMWHVIPCYLSVSFQFSQGRRERILFCAISALDSMVLSLLSLLVPTQ